MVLTGSYYHHIQGWRPAMCAIAEPRCAVRGPNSSTDSLVQVNSV
jgi:hypothetical protein